MSSTELEVAAEERLFDAMLDEVAHERRARPAPPPRGSRQLAAALLLLGLAVVAAVFVASRAPDRAAAAPQEPLPLPPPVLVQGAKGLAALDAATVNVRLQLDPEQGLEGLARLSGLRGLSLEAHPQLEVVPRLPPLGALEACRHLEVLSVGYFGRFEATSLRPLLTLPKLRSLTLVGRDKVFDEEVVDLLAKLALRSLSLQFLAVEPAAFAKLDSLPLLQRFEMRQCSGWETCDLRALYRLKELRAIALRDWATPFQFSTQLTPGKPVTIQLPSVRDGKLASSFDAQWVAGLADALPKLTELDLSGSHIDDDVLVALPRRLQSLRLGGVLGLGERGAAAVASLPELTFLAVGDGVAVRSRTSVWLPALRCSTLTVVEVDAHLTEPVLAALAACSELHELRLPRLQLWRFESQGGLGPISERRAVLDLSPLSNLPKLQRVVIPADEWLVTEVRAAVPASVRVEVILP